jgi:sigma-54 specific flagellar transcriptional regulator A
MIRSKSSGLDNILGTSAAIKRLRAIVGQCANSNAPVLLRGQSGTGKELVSRALHDSSQRAPHPFVAINCGAIPDQLLESELFGHRKGSFTGATCDRKGRFELANMGTLFLDEIGDMPAQLQVKFLRVLEEKVVEPVGGGAEVRIDVRIVAATHRNLEEMVSEGTFREDLLYRLNVLPISIHALHERREDIPILLAHFANVFGNDDGQIAFSEYSLLLLQSYSWPGNVRELANFVQRFSVLYPGKIIDIARVPDDFLTKELIELVQAFKAGEPESSGFSVDTAAADSCPQSQLLQEYEIGSDAAQVASLYENDFERIIGLSNSISELPVEGVSSKDFLNNVEANLIRLALTQTDGNVSKASDLLQLGRTSLIQKISKYQLSKESRTC